jgi:hypothetical protein
MAIPYWDEVGLPQWFLRDNFTRTSRDARLRTKMDTGPDKMRVRGSSIGAPFQGSIICTTAQLARFDNFWEVDTKRGILPFWKRDPVYDGEIITDVDGVPITDESGNVLTVNAWMLVRFGENPPTTVPDGMEWRVSFDLEILLP